jgi:elongation factor 1-beta
MGKAPAAEYANIARWYRNIASYSASDRQKWTGSAVPQVSGGSTTVAASKQDDDDDVDLFGSDEEDDEAAEKLKAERVAAYTAK